jgi:hypothetical protein
MTTSVYAQIEKGIVTNKIMWDGNTDPTTGGWEPPSGAVMAKLPYDPAIGDKAMQNPDGTWSFAPPA